MRTQKTIERYNEMKKILITGSGSYIGRSFEKYILSYPEEYSVDTVSMRGDGWKSMSFSGYDAVLHVAGIAHSESGKPGSDKTGEYRAINTTLAIETAKKAKADGVRQFIFMSSIVVYGNKTAIGKPKVITADTAPSPTNCYGESKLEAEEGMLPLADESFHVAVIRSPMVYGKGSHGNYPRLESIAKRMPFFPRVRNERSMIYVVNLCRFIKWLADNGSGGVFFPQNAEYTNTSEMVRMIAAANGKKIRLVGGMTWLLRILGCFTGAVGKAFGNITYDRALSEYPGFECISLEESVAETER